MSQPFFSELFFGRDAHPLEAKIENAFTTNQIVGLYLTQKNNSESPICYLWQMNSKH